MSRLEYNSVGGEEEKERLVKGEICNITHSISPASFPNCSIFILLIYCVLDPHLPLLLSFDSASNPRELTGVEMADQQTRQTCCPPTYATINLV